MWDSSRALRLKDVLHRPAEELGDFKGQGEAGVVLFGFDGVDGLAGDAEFLGEVGLGPVEQGAQIAHAVFHSYLHLAMPRPRPHSMISKGATQLTSKRGSPAFC